MSLCSYHPNIFQTGCSDLHSAQLLQSTSLLELLGLLFHTPCSALCPHCWLGRGAWQMLWMSRGGARAGVFFASGHIFTIRLGQQAILCGSAIYRTLGFQERLYNSLAHHGLPPGPWADLFSGQSNKARPSLGGKAWAGLREAGLRVSHTLVTQTRGCRACTGDHRLATPWALGGKQT